MKKFILKHNLDETLSYLSIENNYYNCVKKDSATRYNIKFDAAIAKKDAEKYFIINGAKGIIIEILEVQK